MTTVDAGREAGTSVVAGGIATNYHDLGSGDPVLLIHGSGPGVSAWANWRLTLPVLAERYRVIAPDVVGFGYTAAPAGFRYGRDAWSAHLLAFLDALGLERVSVVGNSFGGALALALAHEHPDRVAKLVLMGSVGLSFPLTPGLDAVWGFEPSPAGMRRLMELFVYDPAGLTDELAELRYRAATRPGVAESFAAMFPAPRQRWVDALALDEEQVRGLRHETLVVHGRDDRVIPLAVSLRLASLIERSDLHVFGRCGHWVQIEAHERFTRLVGDFLAAG
ncbi:alpha/beta fold hydrolase [Dactylosporangium sp. CA-092794]|uniref:alpha/beta fold hydrolase n=1 Tax=Dactylosporangium sp. CA-092794 TaxID=3239929 RepID=UPI003D8D0C70